MSHIDWIIITIYLLAIVGLGVAAGFRRRKSETGGEGGHYFLAGNTLTWPVIGLAMFAANISTVHLVSLAEAAYKHGLVFGNFEWMAGFTLILLSLFFAPLYLRSRVATLPDFLERRFNQGCRDVLSVISLFSAIVIHMGVALYTAAWVLRGILGMAPGATIFGVDALIVFITALGLLTGIYTMIGGLLAVVWTESIQTVLLLVGAVVVTFVGYVKIGGWTELAHTLASKPHPLAGITDGCMKECISGVAFADVLINTFFGFAPSLDGKNLLADPQTPRPFTGKLLNVSTRGKKLTISAGKLGVDSARL